MNGGTPGKVWGERVPPGGWDAGGGGMGAALAAAAVREQGVLVFVRKSHLDLLG